MSDEIRKAAEAAKAVMVKVQNGSASPGADLTPRWVGPVLIGVVVVLFALIFLYPHLPVESRDRTVSIVGGGLIIIMVVLGGVMVYHQLTKPVVPTHDKVFFGAMSVLIACAVLLLSQETSSTAIPHTLITVFAGWAAVASFVTIMLAAVVKIYHEWRTK